MATELKKEAQKTQVIDPKRAERELEFVLQCLASSLKNGGRVDFEDIAIQFDTLKRAARVRLLLIKRRYGLTENQRKAKGSLTKSRVDGNAPRKRKPLVASMKESDEEDGDEESYGGMQTKQSEMEEDDNFHDE